jgi:glycogen debranching enzyme
MEVLDKFGQRYVSSEQWPLPEWPCMLPRQALPSLTLKADDLFLITDTLGNISGCEVGQQPLPMGLFCRDSRFLSRLELQINGQAPVLLSSNADQGFALSVLCANPALEGIAHDTIGLKRDLVLNGGLFEDIQVTNYNTQPVTIQLSLSFDADFIDVFEIRGYKDRPQRGTTLRVLPSSEKEFLPDNPSALELPTEELALAYQGLDGAVMESRVKFAQTLPTRREGNTVFWDLTLQPHQPLSLSYRVQLLIDNQSAAVNDIPATLGQANAANVMEADQWTQQRTRLEGDNETFNRVMLRAEKDIFLLRQQFNNETFLAAGVPWFSTLFGRDSLIAAMQTLMLDHAIAKSTLQLLAQYQGQTDDPWRDENPGKILHELRQGEMARCGEVPHTPYYGTVDATPLWLLLYADYFAWTNDTQLLETLWPHALAAMDWIDTQRSRTNGYLTYEKQSQRGLDNQGWKDSRDCIVDRHGKQPPGPIALCEVQGYVYAAKVKLAHIARMKKRLDLAERWDGEAQLLKQRFNQDFWVPDLDFCAMALDGEGRPLDGIGSNPGHCLGLGIFTPEKAESVADRLMAPDMFNGWGIRTLSSDSPAYNPMGYHIGSIWPHDNALIAAGLRSQNRGDAAMEIATSLFDMTIWQPYLRPPELFCGHDRLENTPPVRYPVACSPQAWATGSLFQLLQVLLNLQPDAPSNALRILDPTLPKFLNHLAVHNLRIGSTVLDLEFERVNGTVACRMVRKRGNLRVIIET